MNSMSLLMLRLRVGLFERIERVLKRHSLVGNHRFFDPGTFDWVAGVERHHAEIRRELMSVLRFQDAIPNFQDISTEQAVITNDARWKTFFFTVYGRRMEKNCAICPVTSSALSGIPGMTTAFFSILLPGKSIPIHRGPFCGVLRYHLGVKVPAPADSCGIEVGGERAHWQEGKSLIFDDTYLHRAWNASDQVRVVLFVDFRRPLRFPFSILNRLWLSWISMSPFIRGMQLRHKHWDRVFEDTYRAIGD